MTLFSQKPPAVDQDYSKLETKMEIDHIKSEETGLEKRLTLQEYCNEFNLQIANEAKVFEKTIQMLDGLTQDPKNSLQVGEFLILLVRETETAFVHTQTGMSSIGQAALK